MLKHFALAALSCAASGTLVQPALADNRVPVKLQPAVSYMAPLHVQILDESPEVHDLRQRAQETNYVIAVPPLQSMPAQTVIVSPPGMSSPGGQTMVLNPNHPPPAGFMSNIPGHSLVPAAGLPTGSSTNLLAGHMNPTVQLAPAHGPAPHMISTNSPHQHVAITEQYAPLPSASVSGSSSNTTLNVKARKIGDMLH